MSSARTRGRVRVLTLHGEHIIKVVVAVDHGIPRKHQFGPLGMAALNDPMIGADAFEPFDGLFLAHDIADARALEASGMLNNQINLIVNANKKINQIYYLKY